MKKKTATLNYAFAVAKIRALEKLLIRSEVFEEAMEAQLPEALRLFSESGLYGEELLRINNSRDLDEALLHNSTKARDLIRDLLIDKEMIHLLDSDDLEAALSLVKGYRSEFLNDYVMHLIDMHNIKTFLRLFLLKERPEILQQLLVNGGFMPKKLFLQFYGQDLALFLERLEYVHKREGIIDYAFFLREPVEKLQKTNSFVALEKAISDFLVRILKPAKYFTFGPEPLIAYYFAKINEIGLIRMIILAKLNDVPAAIVKERLNTVYA